MRGIFSLSVRNLRRRPVRTAAAALGIAVLSATALLLSALAISVHQSIDRGSERLGADAVAVERGSGVAYDAETMLLSGRPTYQLMDAVAVDLILAHPDVVETAGQLFIVSSQLSCCTVGDTLLIGFDPDTDFTVRPWLGTTLDRPLEPNEIIAGANILNEPGGRLTFYGTLFRVAAKLDRTGLPSMDNAVFIPMKGARRMIADSATKGEAALDIPPGKISAVMIKFREGVNQERSAIRVEFDNPEYELVLAAQAMRAVRETMSVPMRSIAAAGAFQWVAVLFMVGVLFTLSINERRREAGIMRAVGAKRFHLFRMFLYEGLLTAAMGGILGSVLGVFALYLLADFLRVAMGGGFLMPGPWVLMVLALGAIMFSLLAGLLAVVYPARRASRHSPQSAVRS